MTLWLATMGARKGRNSDGGPGGSKLATRGSSETVLETSWRNWKVNLEGKLWGEQRRQVWANFQGPLTHTLEGTRERSLARLNL